MNSFDAPENLKTPKLRPNAERSFRPMMTELTELHRYLIEDVLIHQCREYSMKDFTFKTERFNEKGWLNGNI